MKNINHIRHIIYLTLIVFFLCGDLAPAFASDHSIMDDYKKRSIAFYKKDLEQFIHSADVISLIQAQNRQHETFSKDIIQELDRQWITERAAGAEKVLINSVMGSRLSERLKEKVKTTNKFITEIFIMDNKGLLVGSSHETSDYWQGDEAKWQETFLKGKDAIHISDRYFDDSSQKTQNQLSVTITDENGTPIGAMTVGINTARLLMVYDD